MKKTFAIAAVLFAAVVGSVALSARADTPDGCQIGNGGHEPICNPEPGTGGK